MRTERGNANCILGIPQSAFEVRIAMRKILVRVVVTNICAIFLYAPSATGQELNPADFRSSSVKSAVSTYNRRIGDAQKLYQKEEGRAREELIGKLETAQKAETMKNNLEEAIRLKAIIDKLKSKSAGPADQTTSMYLGTWKITYMTGHVRFQIVSSQNNQLSLQRSDTLGDPNPTPGQINFVEGKASYLHENNPPILERYTVDGDRLMVEQYYLSEGKTDLNRVPDNMGIAVRIDQD